MPSSPLLSLPFRHPILLCVDSDGTVFDSMLPKQRLCFQKIFISELRLDAAESIVRETLEFVGLFSRTRGINRFAIFLLALEYLSRRASFRATGLSLPDPTLLAAWVYGPGPLSERSLAAELKKQSIPDPAMRLALDWSRKVSACIQGIPKLLPFPGVISILRTLASQADLVIVSATQQINLDRDWHDNNMADIPLAIAGAEAGSKVEQLTALKASTHSPDRILMIGDSPGDLEASRAAGVRFFPMLPAFESKSWQRLQNNIFPALARGEYTPEREAREIEYFLAALPEQPPWLD